MRQVSLTDSSFYYTQASQQAKILQEEALRIAEQRRRIRATMVPTADADVRRILRQIGHPVTLFGEREVISLPSSLSTSHPRHSCHSAAVAASAQPAHEPYLHGKPP